MVDRMGRLVMLSVTAVKDPRGAPSEMEEMMEGVVIIRIFNIIIIYAHVLSSFAFLQL